MEQELIVVSPLFAQSGFVEPDYDYEDDKMNEIRETFAIRNNQLQMEMEAILNKVRKMEILLRREIEQISAPSSAPTSETVRTTPFVDVFRPDPESCPPPQKRARL